MNQHKRPRLFEDAPEEVAETDAVPEYVPEPFPRMLYRNVNGDVQDWNAQRTVTTQDEMDAALADGWYDHPEKALAPAEPKEEPAEHKKRPTEHKEPTEDKEEPTEHKSHREPSHSGHHK